MVHGSVLGAAGPAEGPERGPGGTMESGDGGPDGIAKASFYSPVGNISDSWRLEERPDQMWHALDGGELGRDLVAQLFAAPQRCSGHTGAFHVTPYQFIGVQLGRVAGKKVQRQHSIG